MIWLQKKKQNYHKTSFVNQKVSIKMKNQIFINRLGRLNAHRIAH